MLTISAGPTARASKLGDAIMEAMEECEYLDLDITITITDTQTIAQSSVVLDVTGTINRVLGAQAVIRAKLHGPYDKGIAIVISNREQSREVSEDVAREAAQGLEDLREIHRIIRHLQEAQKAQAHDGMTVREARKAKLETVKAHVDKLLATMEADA